MLRLLATHNPVGALDAWLGPSMSVHDFVRGGAELEVKTTTSVDGNFVSISNIDQLDPPGHHVLAPCGRTRSRGQRSAQPRRADRRTRRPWRPAVCPADESGYRWVCIRERNRDRGSFPVFAPSERGSSAIRFRAFAAANSAKPG